MKKILIFSLAYYPRVGGAEISIKEITNRIPEIEWHMITLRFDSGQASEEKIGNVMVHRVGQSGSYWDKMLFVLRAARMARRLHAQHHFDGMWAMMSYMLLPVVIAKLSIPYVLTLQEGDTKQHMFGRLRILPFVPLLKKGFRNARAVSALSNFLAEWARSMGYQGSVEVIAQGADTQKFAVAHEPHQGTVMVTSSRLVHKNAIDDCIRALALVPGLEFVIAGDGPDESALRALARQVEVEARVQFLGQVNNDALPALFARSDIFVRPSRSEGFGISFVEAMATGLPVIATQEGGLKDYITPEVAFVVEKNRPDQIALQIKAILGNPSHTAQVIERARQLVQAKYTWDTVAKAMREKLFARLFIA